jgi:hypothetical protein
MTDCAVQVDVNMPTDLDVGSNDVASTDDTSVADFDPFGHFDARVDESRATKPGLLCLSDHLDTRGWLADGGDDPGLRMTETRFV